MERFIIHRKAGVELAESDIEDIISAHSDLLKVDDSIKGKIALVSVQQEVLDNILFDHPRLTYSPEREYMINGKRRFVSKEEMYASAPPSSMLMGWQKEMRVGNPTPLDDMVDKAFRAQFNEPDEDEYSN